MSLRFFADHCISNPNFSFKKKSLIKRNTKEFIYSNFIIQTLKDAGYEVFRLRDHIPTDSADIVVISQAQKLDSILVSLNGDFANIVAYPPTNYKGIIALQGRNHPEIIPQLMARLKDYLSAHPDMNHYKGKLLLVEVHRIRVRE